MSKECPKCGYKSVANEDTDICPECGSEMQYTRSGLFMEQIRIIKEMREADERNGRSDQFIRPRFMLWENVVGAFSSNKGEDFRAVLEETAKVVDETTIIPRPPKGKWNTEGCIVGDGWSIAWRVLDAQFWGVPQRRRRIALVADFAGQCAGEILFKREGLSRNFTESRKEGQTASGDIAKGTDASGKHCIGPYDMTHADEVIRECKDGKCNTLNHRMGTGGNQVPIVLDTPPIGFDGYNQTVTGNKINTITGQRVDVSNNPIVFENKSDTPPVTMQIRSGCEGGGKGALLQIDKSATLSCGVPQTLFDPIPIQNQAISNGRGNGSHPSHRGDGYKESETMYTLNTTEQHAVAYDCRNNVPIEEKSGTLQAKSNGGQSLNYINPVAQRCGFEQKAFGKYDESGKASCLKSRDYKDATDLIVEPSYIVRRLTPIECARLQGFPDWWLDGLETEEPTGHDIAFWREVFEIHRKVVTGAKKPKTDKQIIKWLQNPYSDGAAYKLWGNGIALPCFLYVVEGIKEVLDRTSTE